MNTFATHLTSLDKAATEYASRSAFKVPHLDPDTGVVRTWESITYTQFKSDVELFAKYWRHVFNAQGLHQRSVVGLWIGGMTYTDVLHIYGVSRAGFIPQLFSIRLPSAEVIFELLQRANAEALIYDSSFRSILGDSPVPIHLAVNAKYEGAIHENLPDIPEVVNRDDTVFMLHTSGSTSDSPKLVPWSYAFLNACIHRSSHVIPEQRHQRIVTWTGSICHAGQSLAQQAFVADGGCIVQPCSIPFSSEELMDMVERCGLNTLSQFPSYLAMHLRRARKEAKLLSVLQSLDQVVYGGLPLPRDDRDWAYQNGIKLTEVFGSTECGILMLSVGEGSFPHLLRPVEGGSYEFRPVVPEKDSEAGNQSSVKLLELVVLAGSVNCPTSSFRKADGHFHTGDLFEEVVPGLYENRGRDDDWIKSENSLKCDTRAIEDNVRATCEGLVGECIVVGYGRPSPTLVLEAPIDTDQEKLKKDIIRATRPFNSRRYIHERIMSEKMIIVVPPNSLPRTASKGNIRRKAVEEAYKKELDALYAHM